MRTIISLVLTICCAAFLAAAEPRELDLATCLSLGLQHNKDYLAAKKDVEIKQAAERAAFAAYLPSINFTGSYTMLDGTTIDAGNASSKPREVVFRDNWSLGLSATYLIPWIPFLSSGGWGMLRAAHNIAELDLSIASKKLEKVRIDTKAAVTRGFYGLLIAEELFTLTRANQERLSAYVAVAQRNFNAGRISNYELLRARVQLANNTPELLAAENRVALSRASLLQLIGLDQDTPLVVKGRLESEFLTLSEKEALAVALRSRAELHELDLSLKILEWQEEMTANGYKPTFVAFANAKLDYKLDMSDVNMMAIQMGDASSWPSGRSFVPSWNVGVQLSIPLSELFPWSKTRYKVDGAEATVARTRLMRDRVVELIRLEVRQAVLKLGEGEKTIKAQSEAIEMAREGLRMAQARYNAGQMGNVELMDAELDFQRTQVLYYQAWYAYISAMIDLRKATGEDRE